MQLSVGKLLDVRIDGVMPGGQIATTPSFGAIQHAVFVRCDSARARVILPIGAATPHVAARTTIDGEEWWSIGGHPSFYVQARASAPSGILGVRVMVVRPDQTQMVADTSVEVVGQENPQPEQPAFTAIELRPRIVDLGNLPGWAFD